jgi:hypothetical protein
MKKVFPIIVAVCLLVGIAGGYFYVAHKRNVTNAILQNAMSAHSSFKIKVPGGQTVIVLTGVVALDHDFSRTNVVLHMPITGHDYLLFNAPFVYSLRSKAVGKTVTLQGKAGGISNFKHLPVFWVDDVLEIKETAPTAKVTAKAEPKKEPAKVVKKKTNK